MWVILLEKAYAKAYGISNIVGNYENIELGIPSDAIRDLTGAPYEMYFTQLHKILWLIMKIKRLKKYGRKYIII